MKCFLRDDFFYRIEFLFRNEMFFTEWIFFYRMKFWETVLNYVSFFLSVTPCICWLFVRKYF